MYKSAKTVSFKLYNPGQWKKDILDEALKNYSMALQYLLDSAYDDFDSIRKVCGNVKKYAIGIRNWISGELKKELNAFNVEPFKDSLEMDFSAILSGYFASCEIDPSTSFPRVFISEEQFDIEYEELMDEYVDSVDNSKEIEDKIKKLLELKDKSRPIFFCRYSVNRNYSILYDSEKKKFYAKIYLMNSHNPKRKNGTISSKNSLRYISSEAAQFEQSSSRSCFLLFPLSFGEYQQKYLTKAIKNPEILKTARLIKKGSEYYLSINIIEEIQVSIDAENYMGIARGISNAINYSVVGKEGEVLEQGSTRAAIREIDEPELNRIANFLLDKALESKSQIIMEDLIKSNDGLGYKNSEGGIKSSLICSSKYIRFYQILNEKVQSFGLPKIITVSSRDIFYRCTSCGCNTRLNRFTHSSIICTKCGIYSEIDNAGSLNLARKLIKYNNDKIKIVVEKTQNRLRFSNTDLEFEFYPENPYDCVDDFNNAIEKLIKAFYKNIKEESQKRNYIKKLSMIKKIEKNRKIFEIINN